jgi:hypothetical protein
MMFQFSTLAWAATLRQAGRSCFLMADELCGKHDRMMASLAAAIPEMINRVAVLLREARAKATISQT